MAGASRSTATEFVEVAVHNEGPSAVGVQALVHGDSVVVRSIPLESGETGTLTAPTGTPVEVHSAAGTATALASLGAFFVVRDGRVLVSSE